MYNNKFNIITGIHTAQTEYNYDVIQTYLAICYN